MYRYEWWTIKKAECWRIDAFHLGKALESPLDSKEIKPVNPKGNQPWIFIGRTDAEAKVPILLPPDDLKRPWCWERLRAEGERGDREWDGWMASSTQWAWVWANSGRWWRTGKPGILQSMRLQRDTTDRLNNSNNLCFYISTYLLTHQNILSTSQERFNLEIRVLALSWLVAIEFIVIKPDWLADLVTNW